MVLAYNILRGIPIAGGPLWGYGVAAADLPLPEWSAAMTAADQIVDDAPRWQAGWEVSVDEEPADVLDEVLKVCCAKVAEVGGVWKPRVGPPAAPVLFVTDDDLILDRDATLTPFPGLEATFNAIHASYPEPTALWRPKDAPPRYNDAWEAADQGRRLTAELNLPACPWEPQVQRVMRAYIEEERRFGRHVITLPPDAEALEPLDVIAWTSAEIGYEAKLFEVHDITEDPDTLLVTLSLREVDPADYHWQPDYRLPSWVPPVTQPRPDPMVPEYFSVEGIAMADASGRGRQAAGRLRWGGWALDGITGVMWEIRRAGETDTLRGMMADPVAGETIAPGLAPSAGYEARIRFLAAASSAPMDWTAWTPFATPAIEITLEDLGGAPPTAPTGLALDSVPGTLTASWSAGTGAIAYYEIEITEGASAPLIFQTAGQRYEWTGIRPGRNFSARARAVDALGRKSPWGAAVTHVSVGDTVPPAVPTGLVMTGAFNSIWLRWQRNTEEDFSHYEVAAGPAANPTTIVSRTPATSFAVTGLADDVTRYARIRAVDTSGNASGWSATTSATTVPADIDVPDLLARIAVLQQAFITDAHIAELSAATLKSGTALSGSITVDGTALAEMTDPAGLINDKSTQIDPGKIVISGGTTLADWRKGGDETRIDGGLLAPNTLLANAAVIGQRNITLSGVMFEHNAPSPNHVSWSAGQIQYINDNNVPVAVPIAAGSAAWAAGTLYLYWSRGDNDLPLRASTNLGVAMGADNVILASYRGGTLLDSTYGRTVIDEDGIKTKGVKAYHVDVEVLSAITATMGQLTVNDRLTITESGALLSFKTGPYDEGDGLFFGQSGSDGFAFAAARTATSGIRQAVELRDTGFTLLNARHTVSAITSPPPEVITTSQTINLPSGSRSLSLIVVGAGGSGQGRVSTNSWNGPLVSGVDGTPTSVTLRDGTTVIQVWTAAGGAGGKSENIWKAATGQPSSLGSGGAAGRYISPGGETMPEGYPGGSGTRGGGGGAGYNTVPGGMAGGAVVVTDFDISSLTNPNIIINCGVGGAPVGSGRSFNECRSGAGGDGAVQYRVGIDNDIPADVVPLKPTAWGTISKTGLNITFPNLGGGLWVLSENGTSNIDIGFLEVAPDQQFHARIGGVMTFVSSQTPVRVSGGANANRTINYLFYSMGSWA